MKSFKIFFIAILFVSCTDCLDIEELSCTEWNLVIDKRIEVLRGGCEKCELTKEIVKLESLKCNE